VKSLIIRRKTRIIGSMKIGAEIVVRNFLAVQRMVRWMTSSKDRPINRNTI